MKGGPISQWWWPSFKKEESFAKKLAAKIIK